MAENKYTKRRSELKKNLYKLLKEREPDGIPKAHLWNTYSSKVEKISAEFYNVKKMHKFLEVFDDMIKEVMVRGRPTIQLKDGYKPEGEKPSEVQIDRVSSSESEEVSTQGKEKVLRKPVKPVGSIKERESSGERANTQKESPREEVVYQRSTASPSTPVIPVLHQPFVPFPSSTLIRPLMGIPTGFPIPTGPRSLTGLPLCAPPLMMPQQLRQGAIARPVQDSLESSITDAVSEFLSKARKESTVATTGKFPDNPCVVSSGSSSESESSESESDSEVEETKPSKIVDEHKMKIEETRRKVKENVVALLVLHAKDLFDDVMEEYQDEHGIHYMRLKKKAQKKVSDSSDRSTPVIDLTKDEPSTSRRNLVNLTQDQSPSGFIPLSSSKPTHPGDLQMTPADGQPMIQKTPAFLLPTSQSIGFFQLTPQSQAGFIQPTSQSQDSLLRVGQLVIRPVSLRKFEPKETHLPRIWSKDKYGRFSQDQIQMVAKECIEALAEADEHVSVERVENMMLQRFGKRNIAELGNLRNAQQIPCLFDHNRMICKVNAYVQAYLNTHSICTLHELKLCMAEFAPDKDSFEALQIGPLQRLPIIYNHFKFPHDMADIPEITTSDIFENLRNYLNKYQKWSTKLELEHFMEYLVETYHVENAYVLGIRIRSLPLAMQVLKKSQRDAGGTRRKVTEDTKEALKQEIEQAFHRFRAALLSKRGDGQGQIRDHYLQLSPTKALIEIFDKYRLLCSSVEIPANKQERRNLNKFVEAVNNFLQVVNSEGFGRNLFHIALCISKTEVDAIHRQFLTEATKPKEVPVTVSKKPPPTKDSVVKLLKIYLDKCQNHGALTLKSLDHIEERITEHFDFESFMAMGFGRFIEFLLKEAKQELDDCGGTSLGSGGHSEVAGGFLPTLTHILEFVHQCRQCNFSQEEQIQQAICHQFSVNEVKQLGHGATSRLIGLAERPGKHVSNHHSVVYEAAVLPPEGFEVKGQTGILGHQTKEAALACLENCPLLENMAEWSQWTLVFEPQLGKLRDFIQKYGECQTWPLEGGNKIMKTDFIALESSPGQFLRLISSSSPEKFNAALQRRSPREVGGHLMSLVVGSKGVENTPRALLASHIKEELFKLHGEASVDRTPGAPASFQHGEAVVKFVLDCLLVLPVKSCSVLANQMFLDPLGQVVGQSKSKTLLLQSCTTESQVSQLQKLGCMLGVAEWTNSIQARCRPSHASLEEVDPEIADEFFRDDPEPIDDSEDEEDSASTSYLSDVEVETEVKGQVEEEELIVVDERTEIEMEEGDVTGDKQKKEVTIDLTVKSEDNVIDLLSPEPKPEAMSMETDAEKTCRGIVEQIRREEFGIGVELNEDGQRLMRVQQERLGRSLDRLSKDLYSKDTHFVLELIQNADDNSYPDSLGEGECPSVQFIMRPEGVVVLNNETGFADKNIRALCDVGRSTKGKHKAGYIGQKGIGFKSVFRVTDEPEIHSNGFHIKFDVHSGPTGYILPQWVEEDKWKDGEGWTTKIVLPLKESIRSQTTTLAARFNDIHPSLLLFLNRLRKITIDNRVENFVQNIHRKDYGENVVEITHDDKMDRWLVVKKSLDASKISLQAKSGVEVESTEIALAFPLRPPGQKKDSKFVPPKQPVFAFLPLRSYGFRFIVQGDFDVPSSREDVDRDSSWNQWLRNEIHILFLEALEIFKSHADFSNMEAVISFLQFVPVEDEIIDFFRPVANQILQKLRAKPCVPTQPNSKGQCAWKIPSQMVRVKDPLVLEVVTPDLLKDTLNLFYLHRDVAATLNSSLTHSLGIESLNTEHLLLIGKSLSLQWAATDGRDKDSDILMTAKWLACVYRSLNEFTDNQPVYDKLKALKIIPLATYQRQCTADSTIFFPLSENTELSYNDPMSVLQQDLNTIHPLLVSSADSEVNSQVQKLLLKIGVCQLSPREVISHHILPILKSNKVKERSENILISYIVYIKEQTEQDPSLINMEELGASAMLKTNKGLQNPSIVPIHFTPEYKNSINLQAVLPGYDWVLLDPVYLRNKKNPVEIQRWRQFFSKIGLTDFIALKQVNVEISNENIGTTPWAPLKEILGTIPKGSYIKDWSSSEMVDLIQNNSQPTSYPQQMRTLCVLLAEEWDRCFSRYISTDMCTESGGHLKDVDSSFSLLLRTASWVPGTQTCVTVENEEIHVTEKVVMMQPSCLYAPLRDIVDLLSYFVIYIGVQIPSKSSFGQFLRIKYFVDLQDLKKFLIEWGKRDSELTPKLFVTTRQHICRVYLWLRDNLPQRETHELFLDHPVIFVPEDKALPVRFASGSVNRSLGDLQAGRMLNKKEVWWSDPTGLIMKHSDIIQDLHSDLSKKAILYDTYGQEYDLQMLFQNAMRIDMEPSLTEYGELLVLMGQVLSLTDKSVLSDVLALYVTIGRKLRPENSYMPTSNPQTWMNALELQIEALRSKFEGQKILATTNNKWVGIDDHPMIADNREFEKMFEKNDQVNFVVLEDRTPQPRLGGRTAMLDRNLGEKLKPFYEFCSVKELYDCTDVREITQMFIPCPELQLYMHRAVPVLQRYLYKYNPDIYQELQEQDISQRLAAMQFFKVKTLEVKYSLNHTPDVFVLRKEKCLLTKENVFYFHTDHTESYPDINKEIAKMLSMSDERCYRDTRSFLNDLTTALTKEPHTLEEVLDRNDCDLLPEDEKPVWVVKPPVYHVHRSLEQEIEEDVGAYDSEPVGQRQVSQTEEGEPCLKSWPPMSNTQGTAQNRVRREREEKPTESKVWPPPQAPDYIKRVKELPSQFKVTDDVKPSTGDENTSRGGKSSGEGTVGGEVTKGEGYDRQESSEGSQNAMVSRQDSDGKGTKRKISENDTESKGENKRPVLDGEEASGGSHQGTASHGGSSHSTADSASEGDRVKGDARSPKEWTGNDKRHSIQEDLGDVENRDKDRDSEDPRSSGKRRHPTDSSQGSSRMPDSKRLLMDNPVWTEMASDYTYEELGQGSNLKAPPEILQDIDQDETSLHEIGRWGEQIVYHYLLQQKEADPSIMEVKWCNRENEKGAPYDMEISRKTDSGIVQTFIEVKTTKTDDKDMFEISSQQIQFAQEHRENFHIYRVFNAGDLERVRLVRIDNISLRMDQKQVRLWMMI
uniref:Protein NO VEIN C-terminal domain-containing protein n=1 Tax=Magallana gigas TaxID=29159 RepID=A0A8W8JQP2_MAGGI